jgi:hypothetical protein
MLFTTLPAAMLAAPAVLELYRFRWQIELAFKRLKQLLRLGRLPHKDPRAAQTWILAKLVVALLLETLYRNARAISPWGYRFQALTPLPGVNYIHPSATTTLPHRVRCLMPSLRS